MRIRHMLAAQVGLTNLGPARAGRGGIVLAAVALAGAVAGAALAAPAHAAPARSTLTGSMSGGPNQDLALIFRWQKPHASDQCGQVEFTFDSWQLGHPMNATDQGDACAASYFGPLPLLDRAPGKHTVGATAAGVTPQTATYTITPAAGASPTARPSSTARPSPTAAGPTKTAQSRTGGAVPDSATGSLRSVTPSDPSVTASPSVSTSPPVLEALPGTGTRGGGVLAWLLVVFGVVGLGATGVLTTLMVRRSRQVEEL